MRKNGQKAVRLISEFSSAELRRQRIAHVTHIGMTISRNKKRGITLPKISIQREGNHEEVETCTHTTKAFQKAAKGR